ncbi:MAG: GGDEF domain-containing protein [Dokdonella sp.]|jgi:diguanylate cyclase (GGDEF)-like protein|nr:GGDEF domain-containing protein [Dokdonella sp.]MBP6329356.1 GGDEF domain-containing protein [Dokdonella sp.]HQX32436.1 sensor domain-containing diguanylate cyclase [Dokdonella sp.]
MHFRDTRFWIYDLGLLAGVAICVSTFSVAPPAWPPLWAWALFPILQLLVWQRGFPLPGIGMLSMERVPQVAALCLFAPLEAAFLNALPGLFFPFFNRRYRQNSWAVGLRRAVHNACMLWFMSFAAGLAYAAVGGPLPLHDLTIASVVALLVMAAVLQVINNLMMLIYFALDRRNLASVLTPRYLLLEVVFVPFGVLLALILANGSAAEKVLFVTLVVLFVFALHRLNEQRSHSQQRLATLDAAMAQQPDEQHQSRLDAVLEGLYQHMRALFSRRQLFIALREPGTPDFDVCVEEIDGQRLPPSRRPGDRGLAGMVYASGEPVLIDDWNTTPDALRHHAVLRPNEQPGCILMVPIKRGKRVLGVASLQHPMPHFYSEADKHSLLALAEDAAPLLADARTFDELSAYRYRLEQRVAERTAELEVSLRQNADLLEELKRKSVLLEKLSREDDLTALANRRCFDESLDDAIHRAQRYGEALSLLLLDLDHFKRVNDNAGHAAGDAVLRIVAALFLHHARESDLVARLGGEEFAILLPHQDTSGAARAAEHLRAAVAAHDFSAIRPGMHVTLSIGVASWAPGMDRDQLLRRADVALYRAKDAGRNRVMLDGGSPPAVPA